MTSVGLDNELELLLRVKYFSNAITICLLTDNSVSTKLSFRCTLPQADVPRFTNTFLSLSIT